MPITIESRPNFLALAGASFVGGAGAARREREIIEQQQQFEAQQGTIDFIRKSLQQSQSAALDAKMRSELQDQRHDGLMDRIAFEDYGISGGIRQARQLAAEAGVPLYDFFKELGTNISDAESQRTIAESDAKAAQSAQLEAAKKLLPLDQFVRYAELESQVNSMPFDSSFTEDDKKYAIPRMQADMEHMIKNAPKPPTLQQQWDSQTLKQPNGAIMGKDRSGNFREIGKPTFNMKDWNAAMKAEEQAEQKAHLEAQARGADAAPDDKEFTEEPFVFNHDAAAARIIDRMQRMPGFSSGVPGVATAGAAPGAPPQPAPTGPVPAPGSLEGPPEIDPITQSANVRQAAGQLQQLMDRHGRDPAKWGKSKQAGLSLAAMVVRSGGRVPIPIAEALVVDLKAKYPDKKMPARDRALLQRLLAQIGVGRATGR